MMNLQNIGPPMPMTMPRGASAQLQAEKFELNSKPEVSVENSGGVKPKVIEKSKMFEPKRKGEVATQKFMDSMEGELGVTPERILVAMAAMKPNELEEPASATSESFVNNLNVESAARPKAFQLYNQLLVDKGILAPLDEGSLIAQMGVAPTVDIELAKGQIELPPEMLDEMGQPMDPDMVKLVSQSKLEGQAAMSPPTMSPQAKFEGQAAMSPQAKLEGQAIVSPQSKAGQRAELRSKAILEMQEEGDSEKPISEESSEVSEIDETVQPLDGLKFKSKTKGLGKSEAANQNPPVTSTDRRQKLNASIDKMNSSFFMKAENQKKVSQEEALDGMQKTMVPFDRPLMQPRSLVDEVQTWQQNEVLTEPNQGVVKPMMQFSKTGNFESDTDKLGADKPGSDELGSEELSSDEFNLNELGLNRTALSKGDSDFQNQVYGRLNSEWDAGKTGQSVQMNNIDKVRNMQNVIENARILAQKGGGEMQMKLSPEGLGEMQLKVVVANGKVDLELKTQNHEVKKMMESAMNELKSSLAQHSLSIDKVKVDVGSQDSTSTGDNFLKQSLLNDNREQARQFLGQFRENNFSQRNNVFDLPGFKTYQSRERDEIEPATNGPIRPKTGERNKGRGLNLVA